LIGTEGSVAEGDQRQYGKGRNHSSKYRGENARYSRQLVAHHNRPVDSNRSGAGLGNSHQIQHFFLVDPMVLIYKGFFHEGNNHIAAAKGKGA